MASARRAASQSLVLGFIIVAGTDPSTNTVPCPRPCDSHRGHHEHTPLLSHTMLQAHKILKEIGLLMHELGSLDDIKIHD